MNFKIYDDEFDENKPAYIEEINQLSTSVIEKRLKKDWDSFVQKSLTDTRSYYILIFSLNVMKNLDENVKGISESDFYNQCILKAMTFMPDKTFLETSIMIIEKYHKKGRLLALNQGVDTLSLYKRAKFANKKNLSEKK